MSNELRAEKDALGRVMVPGDRLWGAQTQRCLEHFKIGSQRMPLPVIIALAIVKKAAAQANTSLGILSTDISAEIERAVDLIAEGNYLDYVSAEQAFMAVQMLVIELDDPYLEAELDDLANSLDNDERYRPAEFRRLLASLREEEE